LSSRGDFALTRMNWLTVLAVLFVMPVAASVALGQETGNVPETKAPAPTQAAPATAPEPKPATHPDNDYWRKHDQQILTDFPWLARFKEADVKLGPPAAGESRVVFMGDSITEGWHLDESFPGKP
jgi:hypothetical protein